MKPVYKLNLRLLRREQYSWHTILTLSFLAVVLTLVVGALIIYGKGLSPFAVYQSMFSSAFGNWYGLSETLVKSVPLIFTALAAALAFHMQLWNIGAEGQLYMGAMAATGMALFMGDTGRTVLPFMFLAGVLAGALWALIPGALKAYWEVNETITTLLLNYVAVLWVNYLVFGPWRDPQGFNFPLTRLLEEGATLPSWPGSRLHLGLAIAVFLAVAVWVMLKFTRFGFEIKVIGKSREAAGYAGMDMRQKILWVMLISGGIAGLAGMVEVAGVTHRLQQGLSPGYGYTGIIVAWLSRLHPLAIIGVSVFFGGLLVGGYGLQTMGVPFSVVQMLQGLLLFFLLAGELFLNYRISFSHRSGLNNRREE